MALKVYDANEVTVNFGGLPIEAGYDDGEFVLIEQQEDDFVIKVGTDGEVTRSRTNNQLTQVTIKLMQSSSGNAVLSALRLLQLLGGGADVGTLMVRDRQGTSIFVSAEAWINKPPDASFDREAKVREWPLMCAAMKRFDGGN